jgi:hypothetical protein
LFEHFKNEQIFLNCQGDGYVKTAIIWVTRIPSLDVLRNHWNFSVLEGMHSVLSLPKPPAKKTLIVMGSVPLGYLSLRFVERNCETPD